MIKFNFDNTYTSLPSELYSRVSPMAVKQPHLIIFNHKLADELGIEYKGCTPDDLAYTFSGKDMPKGAASIAQAYSGHQFGSFTTLGDGRALLLGEHITPQGKRFDLQFKGSGLTPYSRRGDGKATLSSMLREYLFSEAMYGLGIPTTRSLAVVSTGEAVHREQIKEGAILTRVAASHLRVGTFQHARYHHPIETQKALLDYAINRHYPELKETDTPALSLVEAVMDRQIDLIVNWMRVGFIHGVMNTDNMTISGETIDYGPCAFMNAYDPSTVFSSIDHNGRYAYENQPGMAMWNLTRLAESLLPLIDDNSEKAISLASDIINRFEAKFRDHFLQMMYKKIGIENPKADDAPLLERLIGLMKKHKMDYTNTFLQLMYPELDLNPAFKQSEVKEWIKDWKNTLGTSNGLVLMKKVNPIYIPRNYLVEEVLSKASDDKDMTAFNQLLGYITEPYDGKDFKLEYIETPKGEFDFGYQTFCGT